MSDFIYCWIKFSAASRNSIPGPISIKSNSDLQKITRIAEDHALSTNSGCVGSNWDPNSQARPAKTWLMEAAFDGIKPSDSWFSMSPQQTSHSAAITWLIANQNWLTDATNYALYSFNLDEITDKAAGNWTPPSLSWEIQAQTMFGTCNFGLSNWGNKFKDAWEPMLDASGRPKIGLPANCLANFNFTVSGTTAAECAILKSYELSRDDLKMAEITIQAASKLDAVWPVQRLLGDFHLSSTGTPKPLKPATCELIAEVLDAIQWPIFTLKRFFDRGRPGTCCTEANALNPMFPNPSPLHPRHPSFPSAHACNAHAVALVLNQIKPKPGLSATQSAYEDAADGVGLNREIAGLHYPSDTACGKALARFLVPFLIGPTMPFESLLDAAKLEW